MHSDFGLPRKTIEKINQIFAKHPNISKVILYGSRAKGNYTPGSDIDLTLVGDNIDLHQLNKISNELDDLLLPYTFDLSIFDHIASSEIIEHIRRVGKAFFIRHDEPN